MLKKIQMDDVSNSEGRRRYGSKILRTGQLGMDSV